MGLREVIKQVVVGSRWVEKRELVPTDIIIRKEWDEEEDPFAAETEEQERIRQAGRRREQELREIAAIDPTREVEEMKEPKKRMDLGNYEYELVKTPEFQELFNKYRNLGADVRVGGFSRLEVSDESIQQRLRLMEAINQYFREPNIPTIEIEGEDIKPTIERVISELYGTSDFTVDKTTLTAIADEIMGPLEKRRIKIGDREVEAYSFRLNLYDRNVKPILNSLGLRNIRTDKSGFLSAELPRGREDLENVIREQLGPSFEVLRSRRDIRILYVPTTMATIRVSEDFANEFNEELKKIVQPEKIEEKEPEPLTPFEERKKPSEERPLANQSVVRNLRTKERGMVLEIGADFVDVLTWPGNVRQQWPIQEIEVI